MRLRVLVLMVLVAAGFRAAEAAENYSAAEVKAAFLFHFATYVEWPAPHDTIVFAILEAPEIARELTRFTRDRHIQERDVEVRRIRSIDELDGAAVLYTGSVTNRRLTELIERVDSATLIVADAPDALSRGAMINFQLIDRRVRFEIAVPAAERAGLTLSSRLLSAALRVEMTRCHTTCSRYLNPPHPIARRTGADGLRNSSPG